MAAGLEKPNLQLNLIEVIKAQIQLQAVLAIYIQNLLISSKINSCT